MAINIRITAWRDLNNFRRRNSAISQTKLAILLCVILLEQRVRVGAEVSSWLGTTSWLLQSRTWWILSLPNDNLRGQSLSLGLWATALSTFSALMLPFLLMPDRLSFLNLELFMDGTLEWNSKPWTTGDFAVVKEDLCFNLDLKYLLLLNFRTLLYERQNFFLTESFVWELPEANVVAKVAPELLPECVQSLLSELCGTLGQSRPKPTGFTSFVTTIDLFRIDELLQMTSPTRV